MFRVFCPRKPPRDRSESNWLQPSIILIKKGLGRNKRNSAPFRLEKNSSFGEEGHNYSKERNCLNDILLCNLVIEDTLIWAQNVMIAIKRRRFEIVF